MTVTRTMNGVPLTEEEISRIVISNTAVLEIFKEVQDRVNNEFEKGETHNSQINK